MIAPARQVTCVWLALTSAVLLLQTACATGHQSLGELRASIEAADRPEADVARDAGRKPADVLSFLGVEPGMTVVDLIAAGGYYTEVLSVAVGPTGTVYAQNSEFVLKMRDGANEKAISKRLSGDRLPNVKRLDREISDLGLAPGSVDFAITALNFHDIYNARGREAAARLLVSIFELLEPGGALGIIDHVGSPGADNEKLHRIDPALVVATIEASPFELEARSDVLRNETDDHSAGVFDPDVRGKTDRFVFLLRKPS